MTAASNATKPQSTIRSSSPFRRRLWALTKKESRQLWRDKSNLMVGILLPAILILLFGYGISFDVKNTRIAVVVEDHSPVVENVIAGLAGSTYLEPVRVNHIQQAEALMRASEVKAIVRIPQDFSRQLNDGKAQIQLLTNGIDTTTANSMENFISGAIQSYGLHQADRNGQGNAETGVMVVSRMWYNEAANSHWFVVPGLIVMVVTLIGAFLTALLIAREWERGTLESLFVTPVRPLEIIIAKLIPYALIGVFDVFMCMMAARYLFEVPIRGSISLIVIASLLYLWVALLLGLVISARTRNQFLASQMSLIISFLPALMLSGFVFDLHNVPVVVQAVSQILPATHFVSLLKTLFLAGTDWQMFWQECGILVIYIVLLTLVARRLLPKSLD
ncbi:ABC transporter permease [Oceanobacter mangrovi]|uniref:ABC transporter permease n=1 Tax=Oceanobacter mangrovi TaxID=2862510 RepID=UPI001C8DBFD5|nr:ABC transporter permease [Oceanobacter mangrovi]